MSTIGQLVTAAALPVQPSQLVAITGITITYKGPSIPVQLGFGWKVSGLGGINYENGQNLIVLHWEGFGFSGAFMLPASAGAVTYNFDLRGVPGPRARGPEIGENARRNSTLVTIAAGARIDTWVWVTDYRLGGNLTSEDAQLWLDTDASVVELVAAVETGTISRLDAIYELV